MGTFVITSKEKNPQSILGPVRWLRIVLLLTPTTEFSPQDPHGRRRESLRRVAFRLTSPSVPLNVQLHMYIILTHS